MEVTPSKRKPSNLYSSSHHLALERRNLKTCVGIKMLADIHAKKKETNKQMGVNKMNGNRAFSVPYFPIPIVEQAGIPHPMMASRTTMKVMCIRTIKTIQSIQSITWCMTASNIEAKVWTQMASVNRQGYPIDNDQSHPNRPKAKEIMTIGFNYS